MCSVWLDVAEVKWECHEGRGGWEAIHWEGQGRLATGSVREALLGCLAAMGGLMKA